LITATFLQHGLGIEGKYIEMVKYINGDGLGWKIYEDATGDNF